MPDGSASDPRAGVRSKTSNPGTVSHPLMGSTRSEPALRNPADHSPPPVNIRMTIPFLGQRFYFTVLSGKERRSKERLALERQANPLRTKRNITFIVVGALILYLLTLGTFLVLTSVF